MFLVLLKCYASCFEKSNCIQKSRNLLCYTYECMHYIFYQKTYTYHLKVLHKLLKFLWIVCWPHLGCLGFCLDAISKLTFYICKKQKNNNNTKNNNNSKQLLTEQNAIFLKQQFSNLLNGVFKLYWVLLFGRCV